MPSRIIIRFGDFKLLNKAAFFFYFSLFLETIMWKFISLVPGWKLNEIIVPALLLGTQAYNVFLAHGLRWHLPTPQMRLSKRQAILKAWSVFTIIPSNFIHDMLPTIFFLSLEDRKITAFLIAPNLFPLSIQKYAYYFLIFFPLATTENVVFTLFFFF